MEYTILSAPSPEELSNKVNWYMREGWRPLGGLAVVENAYYQAMVRG